MPGKRVLLVGDWAHRDFCEAADWLAAQAEPTFTASVTAGLAAIRHAGAANPLAETTAEPSAAQGDCQSAPPRLVPDVIVVAQSRPGQIRPLDVERLHAASPLSRLVVLVGSWCEGELRSGRPCQGVIRVLWHQWQPRLMPFLQPGAAPIPGSWQLPRTASLDERLACTVGPRWPRHEGLVAIHADTHPTFMALSEACHAGGYATVWHVSEESVAASGVVAAVADGISCDTPGIRFLRQTIRCHRPAPVIALLDFVRRQDLELAKSEGVSAVVAKPFLVYDLLWHLDRSVASSRVEQQPLATDNSACWS
jgi:hypothetical protein